MNCQASEQGRWRILLKASRPRGRWWSSLGRGDGGLDPEQTASIVLDLIDDDERDALCFVELAEAQRRFEKHAQERHRTALRAESLRT
jgi:hypothetical protein